ncbi:hypothetical protein E2C01_052907 [Portunus trituberculatus]|uniref:Uncharacterized protein n=1 Tax=Portunus trituberculatus TaxID=210409 RepID=A0A5B7GN21_PORTR|nr:hypothetical protein [Portunus trituberculatus]
MGRVKKIGATSHSITAPHPLPQPRHTLSQPRTPATALSHSPTAPHPQLDSPVTQHHSLATQTHSHTALPHSPTASAHSASHKLSPATQHKRNRVIS